MFEALAAYLKNRMFASEQQIDLIKPYFTPRYIRKGEILLQAGDICTTGYFVVEGCLRSYAIDKKGKEHVIQFAPENWWISEAISMIRSEPAMFYMDALEDTSCLTIGKEFMTNLPGLSPDTGFMFHPLYLNSQRAMQKRLISLLSNTGEEKYLEFIRMYPSLALRVPQRMIASYLGITPESLSRIRKELAHS